MDSLYDRISVLPYFTIYLYIIYYLNYTKKLYYASQIHRVVNVWNNLPVSVNLKSLSSFKLTVKLVDLSKFLKCFKDVLIF